MRPSVLCRRFDAIGNSGTEAIHRLWGHTGNIQPPGAHDIDASLFFEPIRLHGVEPAVREHSLLRCQERKVSIDASLFHSLDELRSHL